MCKVFFCLFFVVAVGLFVDVGSSSLSYCCHCFGSFLFVRFFRLFSFLEGSAVFISMWTGAG